MISPFTTPGFRIRPEKTALPSWYQVAEKAVNDDAQPGERRDKRQFPLLTETTQKRHTKKRGLTVMACKPLIYLW